MNNIEITIDGVVYPCRQTMGAMLRFKKETGKELTELRSDNVSDLCTYLWCCVKSSSNSDKISFDMSLIDFADAISVDDLNRLAQQMQGDAVEESEKKS